MLENISRTSGENSSTIHSWFLWPFPLFSPRFVVMFTDDLGHISQWSSIMAGSLAGMVSTIVTYPTDLIKTRLIVQNMLEPSYRGLLHAFSTIYQQEGFLALYRGVSLTVVGKMDIFTLSKKRLCPLKLQMYCIPLWATKSVLLRSRLYGFNLHRAN